MIYKPVSDNGNPSCTHTQSIISINMDKFYYGMAQYGETI